MSHCTEELIWLNEREEEEIAFDWSDNNPNMNAKRELYSVSAVDTYADGFPQKTQSIEHKRLKFYRNKGYLKVI